MHQRLLTVSQQARATVQHRLSALRRAAAQIGYRAGMPSRWSDIADAQRWQGVHF
jgi:hypothetical protein